MIIAWSLQGCGVGYQILSHKLSNTPYGGRATGEPLGFYYYVGFYGRCKFNIRIRDTRWCEEISPCPAVETTRQVVTVGRRQWDPERPE